jgi:hypothetical protein
VPARKGQKYKHRTCFAVAAVTLTCALCPRQFTRNHSQHKYCGRCRRRAALQKMKEWRENNKDPEGRREYFADYYAENAEQIIAKTKAYSQTGQGRDARRVCQLNQWLRNPKKMAARQAVRAALSVGFLVKQPCEECGATVGVQAHHEDYDRPLDVNWLCVKDHNQRHRERGDGPSSRTPLKRSKKEPVNPEPKAGEMKPKPKRKKKEAANV